MKDLSKEEGVLMGQLLVAHPSLSDVHFSQSVILLTAHESSEGALGVIINKPLYQTLGEIRPELLESNISLVPVYRGGPLKPRQVLLAGWLWNVEQQSFRLYFGLNAATFEKMREKHPQLVCRAFLGYAGWGEHQLEAELVQRDWFIGSYGVEYKDTPADELWQKMIIRLQPQDPWFKDIPENPSLN